MNIYPQVEEKKLTCLIAACMLYDLIYLELQVDQHKKSHSTHDLTGAAFQRYSSYNS